MDVRETRNSRLGATMVKNLEHRHFEAHYCPTRLEAIELIDTLIADGSDQEEAVKALAELINSNFGE